MFVARGGVAELTTTILTADEVRDLVERMLKSSGRRVDLSLAVRRRDAARRLAGCTSSSRTSPATHWAVNIRKFVVRADHLDDLVAARHADAAGRARSSRPRSRRA